MEEALNLSRKINEALAEHDKKVRPNAGGESKNIIATETLPILRTLDHFFFFFSFFVLAGILLQYCNYNSEVVLWFTILNL